MNNLKQLKHFASGLAVVLFLFLLLASDDDQSESGLAKQNNSINATDSEKLTPEKLKEQLNREIASFNKPFNNKSYDGTIEAIQTELALFAAWATIIKEGEISTLKENMKLAKELKNKVEILQTNEFPILRKRYGKILANRVWEHDIYIHTIGKNNTILDITGATFSANINIKEFQSTLNEALTMFRFKQTRYRWYKGADEYTYFTLDVPSDKNLVILTK